MSNYYYVGKIVNTHGIHGEVKVLTLSDFKEERYQSGNRLTFFRNEDSADGIPLTIASHRTHQQFDLLAFVDHSSIEDVEPYKGGFLKVKKEDRSPLVEDEYYFDQIIGCTVLTEDGKRLGTIDSILTPGANDVWVIKPDDKNKEILIPYIEDVVKQVDVSGKEVIIHKMAGLIDEE